MADVKWIKITTDMFDNRKIKHLRRLPDGDSIVLIWVMLLTLAGRCNSNGLIFLTENIPYTSKMLADELDFEESTVQLAIQALEQLGMVTPTGDGFIAVTGWEEHQNVDRLAEIREYSRLAKQRSREKQKLLTDVKDKSRTDVKDKSRTSQSCQDPDIEEDKNKSKKKKEEIIYSSVPELNAAILSFVEFRKKIKKPMTDRAIELLIGKLEKLTDSTPEQIEILNQSILNGWTGIFPLKKGAESNGRNTERASETAEYGTYL